VNRFSDSSDPVPGRQDTMAAMIAIRGMPWGVALFLVYALLILGAVGLALGPVVEQAVLVPITFTGVVLMALLAYTIFTITLVLQRKAAARTLALGLVTLAVPAVPLAALGKQLIAAAVIVILAVLLVRGLRTPAAAAWLDQE
jgi:hypothetical protein